MSDSTKTELATLGGGCFWCMEAVFQQIRGVISVTSGYSGGFTKNPTYKEVCEGNTGHAEVIQIKFNPEKISYSQILDIFWKAHDPTSLNRQGADIGTQYRSIILYHNDEQRKIAEASRAKASKDFAKPIVTEIMPFTAFYKAEEYHQNFFKNNPEYGYCQAVIKPKLEKLKEVLKSNESKPNPH
ncbi:MAG: peptide-methionine (S)-S-oxide reductase MsrA [Verrucomicrobiia bacterium]